MGGGVALLIKLVILNGALGAVGGSPTPLRIALVVGILVAVAGAVNWVARIRGTRRLPDHIRSGLRGDHRNSALRAVRVAGVLAIPLGVWSALIPSSAGGGGALAAALLAFAVAGLFLTRHFWVGPRLGREVLRRAASQALARLRRA